MKKTLMGIALMALGAIPFTVNAQNNNTVCTPCPQTCNLPAEQCTPCPNICDGPAQCYQTYRDSCRNACLYNGIELTDTQKGRIADLDKGLKQSIAEQRQQAKAAGDSAKASRRQQARDLRAKYLEGMRQVLTPAQYTQFLENYYLSTPSKGAGYGKAPKVRKGDRRFDSPKAAKFDKSKKFNGDLKKKDFKKDKKNK